MNKTELPTRGEQYYPLLELPEQKEVVKYGRLHLEYLKAHRKGYPQRFLTEEDKLADPRYKLARKDALIKQLEMENELMRDFLSLTEKK